MPELQAKQIAGTRVFQRADVTGAVGVRLELSSEQFVAVVEEELIGGFRAGQYTVLHNFAGARRARQVLNLYNHQTTMSYSNG